MNRSEMGSPRLKALELQGYKTFATKNNFEFGSTITVIVGPNGSGKSNIADSIRWVLGEQSYSLLRGKRTEDMIFSGSETRPRASMAAATIVFDNEDGWLPIDFTEVTISRRAYRDGVNEYLLNGQRVRLKDVSELLAKCGIGQRTYTIIGQGLVDAALSLNPEERRRLFEEAAGIGLYRSRKEEALRRLDTTRRNLERVQDIITELRPRLRSLERQAKRARDYEQLKEDLDAILRIWYGYHWYDLQDQVLVAVKNAKRCEKERDNLRVLQLNAEQELHVIRSRIDAHRSQLREWSHEISALFREREEIGRKLAVSNERVRWLEERIDLTKSEITGFVDEKRGLLQRVAEAEKELAVQRANMLDAQQNFEQVVVANVGEVSEGEENQQLITHLREELEAVASEQAKRVMHLEDLSLQYETVSLEIEESIRDLKQTEANLEGARSDEEQAASSLTGTEEKFEKLTRVEVDEKKVLEVLTEEKQTLVERRASNLTREADLNARLDMIRKVRWEYNELVNRLLGASKEGQLRGLVGQLQEKLVVRTGFQDAIFAAVGDFRNALIFQSMADVEEVLGQLGDEADHGQAALLPLIPLRSSERLEPVEDPGCLGNAVEFVEMDEDYQPLVNLILGRTLVVRDQAAADRILANIPLDSRLVTLNGRVIYAAGQIVLGGKDDPRYMSDRPIQEALLGVQEDLLVLNQEITGKEGEIDASRELLIQLGGQINRGREVLEEARLKVEKTQLTREAAERDLQNAREVNDALERKRAEIENDLENAREVEADFSRTTYDVEIRLKEALVEVERKQPAVARVQAEARLEVVRQTEVEAKNRLHELSGRVKDLESDLSVRLLRQEKTQDELEQVQGDITTYENVLGEIEGKISILNGKIQPEEEILASAEGRRSELEAEGTEMRAKLQNAERSHSQAQIDLARRQEEMLTLRRRIEDDFGLVAFDYEEGQVGQEPLPFDGLVERLQRVEELPEGMEKQVNSLRNQLRRLGVVNPEAMREYREVRKRVNFLTSQVEDLQKAEVQILEVIAELDLLMEREFRKTFDAVAIEFRDAFTRLFGGGSARLTLKDPGDLTRTGIDIEARLPGRREQGLAMLSGGERSLTACALIFALMKISPTPFCVLDEVDAMLDEANVVRFREMLEELSRETQFVVITHNRQTVQAAEIVYGITMGSDSASQIVSLKLDEAEEAIMDGA